MNSFAPRPRKSAFTLVELLTVIAIIAILAAVLLPVLSGTQRRAQRVWCENNLREIGLAFHTFADDHGGKFPMAVSTNDGGSMEYVQSGFSAGQIFYTSFRSFQALSAELVKPQVLTCLSDTIRSTATNFPAVQNQNVSYFVGIDGNFDKPASILAGDRNLATNSFQTPTILQIGPEARLHWTWELHQFQGNVLFADGHVEEWNNPGLSAAANQMSPDEHLFLPSVAAVDSSSTPMNSYASPPPYGSSPASASGSAGPQTQSGVSRAQPSAPASPPSPGQMDSRSEGANQKLSGTDLTPPQSQSSSEAPSSATQNTTNAMVGVLLPGAADSMMSPFDCHLTKILQHTFEWFYLLLLLLLLLYLLYKLRKWMREREASQRDRQTE